MDGGPRNWRLGIRSSSLAKTSRLHTFASCFFRVSEVFDTKLIEIDLFMILKPLWKYLECYFFLDHEVEPEFSDHKYFVSVVKRVIESA